MRRSDTRRSGTSLAWLGLALVVCASPSCGHKAKAGTPRGDAGAGLAENGGRGNTVCKTDDDCEGSNPLCDAVSALCVECLTGNDCRASDACVMGECRRPEACSSSRDCAEPLVCSDDGRCVECVSNAECPGAATCAGNACRATCASDRTCLPSGLLCDRDALICVECLSSEDCSDRRECEQGHCAAAAAGAAGSDGGGAPTARAGSPSDAPSEAGAAAGAQGGTGGAATGGATPTGSSGTGATDPSGGTAPGSGATGGASPGSGGGTGETGGTPSDGGTGATGATPSDGGAGAAPAEGVCGDGLLDDGEACDDGNDDTGDGCAPDCTQEPGYHCAQPAVAGTLVLPAIFRDFRAGGDFEPDEGSRIVDPSMGLVAATLDAEGKPEFVGEAGTAFITNAASYSLWYRDTPGTNSAFPSSLTLWRNDDGSYANRWGDHGEYWLETEEEWCGSVGQEVDEQPCTFALMSTPCDGAELAACVERGGGWWGELITARHNGNPLFFPLDGAPGAITPESEYDLAIVPPPYSELWPFDPSGNPHNFHFTSEIHFRFTFDAASVYWISISGDDDVWLFVNQRLALDLGGIHTPVSGTATLNPDGTSTAQVVLGDGITEIDQSTDLGLQPGQTYDVAVFHAERKAQSSTLLLWLNGFVLDPVQCMRP